MARKEERKNMGLLKVVVAIVVVAAIVLLIMFLGFGIRFGTADVKGAVEAQEQRKSGDFRITAYDQFFALCQSVQTFEDTIDSQKRLLVNYQPGERLHNHTLQTIAANESGRAGAINDYNAKATQDYTFAQFQSSKLPFQLSRDPYNSTNRTVCATR